MEFADRSGCNEYSSLRIDRQATCKNMIDSANYSRKLVEKRLSFCLEAQMLSKPRATIEHLAGNVELVASMKDFQAR